MPGISRRAALLGGLGGVAALAVGGSIAVDEGVLPGRHPVRSLPEHGSPAATSPGGAPARSISGSFESAARLGARTGWKIAYPAGAAGPLRVLVVLHGRGGDYTAAFGNNLGLDQFLAQATSRGAHPFAIAGVDGGDHSFWHPRSDGSDAGAMVLDEFIPLLGRHGLDVSRVGLMGVSMGGYGALWLATLLGVQRVAVVVAESPALWHHAGDTTPGAFDGAADFDARTIFGRERELDAIPLRIDCGTSDPFAPATRDLRAELSPRPAGGLEPGKHNVEYWRRMAPAQIAFVAAHIGH